RVARIASHRRQQICLRLRKLTQMKVSVTSFGQRQSETAILLAQSNRARHCFHRLLVTVRPIVNDACIVVTEVELRIDSNHLKKIAQSFFALPEMLVSQTAKPIC